MNDNFLCSICGAICPASELIMVGDQSVCEACADETLICHICGERIFADDNAGDSNTPLCQSCYERSYTHCSRCGELLHYNYAYYSHDDPDEEEPLCHDCYIEDSSVNGIQNYYYKPEPIFYGSGNRYFGVELEIDEGGEYGDNADALMEIANRAHPHIYCKHDGSLSDGFEIVTHPMTLDYHQNSMPWEPVLSKAVSMAYLSHRAATCGLHVHVNRSTFGATEAQQDACIARILYFVEKHWEELLKFSRRTERQLRGKASPHQNRNRQLHCSAAAGTAKSPQL